MFFLGRIKVLKVFILLNIFGLFLVYLCVWGEGGVIRDNVGRWMVSCVRKGFLFYSKEFGYNLEATGVIEFFS